ncbi:initiation-specific alpha-1 [Anaeramoeba flamelloides]|uniref:Initiation-specific alpha-1 n=1 Tax=Anaeramoeba flamelloides TaxID=1746091 RepID=A0ABQ8X5A4_9EUKA|nr:initiation-specific alpha-1 [Anaeramoeba flamelloides]
MYAYNNPQKQYYNHSSANLYSKQKKKILILLILILVMVSFYLLYQRSYGQETYGRFKSENNQLKSASNKKSDQQQINFFYNSFYPKIIDEERIKNNTCVITNPGFNQIALTLEGSKEFLQRHYPTYSKFMENLPIALFSQLIPFFYLNQYGGIYVAQETKCLIAIEEIIEKSEKIKLLIQNKKNFKKKSHFWNDIEEEYLIIKNNKAINYKCDLTNHSQNGIKRKVKLYTLDPLAKDKYSLSFFGSSKNHPMLFEVIRQIKSKWKIIIDNTYVLNKDLNISDSFLIHDAHAIKIMIKIWNRKITEYYFSNINKKRESILYLINKPNQVLTKYDNMYTQFELINSGQFEIVNANWQKEHYWTIPNIIHQTWKNRYDEIVYRSMVTWRSLNPAFQYYFYTDQEMDDYVKTFFPRYFEMWDDLPGVVRSDIFRYLIIYREGGIYSDIDTRCVKPIREWGHLDPQIRGKVGMIIGIEMTANLAKVPFDRILQWCQWTYGGAPGHPILINTVERAYQYWKKGENLEKITSFSGPRVWSKAIFKYQMEPHNDILLGKSPHAFVGGLRDVDPTDPKVCSLHDWQGSWKKQGLKVSQEKNKIMGNTKK